MSEISTDLTAIKSSKCFGIAWDGECKECNMCEVAKLCKQRTLGGVKPATKPATATKEEKEEEPVSTMKPATARPEPKKAAEQEVTEVEEAPAKKVAKAKPKKEKEEVQYADDMPEFKAMSVEELLTLAKERGLSPANFDKYTNTNIKKMRITMALKKTYVVE